MTPILRFALITMLSATSCLGQTGTVTFYSRGLSAKNAATAFFPKSEQPFGGMRGGWLFDGAQRLARIRAGRFAIFHLNPGEHTFADEGPAGPSKKPLVINVREGGHYCVRLFSKMMNLEVYAQWEDQIEEVPCQQAQREAAHLKPIEIKRVEPAVRSELDPARTIPSEGQTQH
ncbi:MAG TPA: hypothetical protein VGR64_01955 [Terracidiphilus sp.]|nr:hypothetical protein [Terracidiphilus sp.]